MNVRRGGSRRARTGKKKRSKESRDASRTYHVDGVGPVPLIPDPDVPGALRFDPDFEPRLPAGAVRGDIRQQNFGYGLPQYFYVDSERKCVQCGELFVFGAAEQKHWFETLGFNRHSTAIRCSSCRRKRRTQRALRVRYQEAVPLEESSDPAKLFEFCEALCALNEATGDGEPDRVIAAARKARRNKRADPESSYWQARGHEIAGRVEKAADLYQKVVDLAAKRPVPRRLLTDAKLRVAPPEA